jgi:hypothetical protein
LGKESSSSGSAASYQNGVNDNNWNDNDNANDNVGVVGGLSPELLSPPFLPLPNALYPPAKHASYLIEPLLEWDDLLQWKHFDIDCKSDKHPQHINVCGKTSQLLRSLLQREVSRMNKSL